MLSPITPTSLAGLRQLADKMEKILLVALENYGNTFVEPKVELGARFGHLVCECCIFDFVAIVMPLRAAAAVGALGWGVSCGLLIVIFCFGCFGFVCKMLRVMI